MNVNVWAYGNNLEKEKTMFVHAHVSINSSYNKMQQRKYGVLPHYKRIILKQVLQPYWNLMFTYASTNLFFAEHSLTSNHQ